MNIARRRMSNFDETVLWTYLQMFAMSLWVHILPVSPVLFSLFVLIGLDTVLGVWASIKKGRAIVSGRAWRIFTKTCVITIVMVATEKFHGIAKNIWDFDAISIVALTFALVEFKSILENAQLILGQPLFKWMVHKLDSKNLNKPKGE